MATASPRLTSPKIGRAGRRVVLPLLLGSAGLFALDAALFRTHAYLSVLEPDSSTGYLELILWRERRAQHGAGDNLVATVGNSRFYYSPKAIDRSPVKTGYVLRQAGVAGTNPQVWYYILRDLDPTA